jgi:3-(3-hydroxy-phenyl)propionate hydroxylase
MKDVAILGYGPVGALLANLLGQAGLSVAVYERDTAIHPLPRAVHFDGEVMRIFQSAGLAERIAGASRPSSQGMHFVNAEGRTLMVRRGIDGPGPHGWANNWYFHQPALEQILRDGVGRFANVDVHLGREIADMTELGPVLNWGKNEYNNRIEGLWILNRSCVVRMEAAFSRL